MFALGFLFSDFDEFFRNGWSMIPLVLVYFFLVIFILLVFNRFLIFEGLNSILENFKIFFNFFLKLILFLFVELIDFISLIEVLASPLSGDHDIVVKVLLGEGIFVGGLVVIDLLVAVCEV